MSLIPSSAKLSLAIDSVLKPLFDAGGKYEGKVKAIIRLQVQPWHSSSTLTHESALAVGIFPSTWCNVPTFDRSCAPLLIISGPIAFRWVSFVGHETLVVHIFWQLFKRQGEFFDIPTSTLTPVQIRENLAQVAAQVIPSNAMDEFRELLKLKGSPNGGVAVTDDLKYTSAYFFIICVQSDSVAVVKFSRQNGVHVSPTVLWDGLVAGEISSSWGEKEWDEFLAAKVIV